jgi:hypothetical protein
VPLSSPAASLSGWNHERSDSCKTRCACAARDGWPKRAQIYSDILRAEPRHFEALHALGSCVISRASCRKPNGLIAQAHTVNPQAAEAQLQSRLASSKIEPL